MSDRLLSALKAGAKLHAAPPPSASLGRGRPVPVPASDPGRDWQTGMTRGAWDYPFRGHRTLAELARDGGEG